MPCWVLVLRGFDLDESGILDVEARIKAALPELEPRCVTVRESLFEVMYHRNPQPPPLARVLVPFASAEHEAPHGSRSGHRVRTKGA